MIQIQVKRDLFHNPVEITVEGHANYAPHGQDIVCAAVSVLIQTVSHCLQEREDTTTYTEGNTSGFQKIVIGNPTRESYLLTEVFTKGAYLLAEQYPAYVHFDEMTMIHG